MTRFRFRASFGPLSGLVEAAATRPAPLRGQRRRSALPAPRAQAVGPPRSIQLEADVQPKLAPARRVFDVRIVGMERGEIALVFVKVEVRAGAASQEIPPVWRVYSDGPAEGQRFAHQRNTDCERARYQGTCGKELGTFQRDGRHDHFPRFSLCASMYNSDVIVHIIYALAVQIFLRAPWINES